MKKALITIFAIIGVISTLLILVGVGYFLGMKNRTSAPVPTATATPEPTATSTPVPTPTPTVAPTATSTPSPEPTSTVAPTATPSPTPTNTPIPTATSTNETPKQQEDNKTYDSEGNQYTIIRYAEEDWKTMYSTGNTRTRTGPSTSFEQASVIYKGDQAILIGECTENKWSLIRVGSQEMWLNSLFLSEEASITEEIAKPTPTPTQSNSDSSSTNNESTDTTNKDNNTSNKDNSNSSSSSSKYEKYYTTPNGKYTIGINYSDTEAKVTVNGTTYTIPLQVEPNAEYPVNSNEEQMAWEAIYPTCGWHLDWDDDSKGFVIPDPDGGEYIGGGINFN